MSTPGELAPGTEFAGYRIESSLGHGGMAVVYLARHLGLERRVAIKVLAPTLAEDDRFRERFVRESRLAASLDHPNVIPIYEAGEADGRLFIAMRYVDGTDLKGQIREFGRMDPGLIVPILRQVAGALDAAHAKGLVHRDVKPANVLIARAPSGETAGAHAYLSDFGLTRRTSSDSGLTGTGQFMGTLDYAAPEQFEGKATDARTDVYALGCVLVEMLTGHPPYTAEFDAALMFAHISEPPPTPTTDHPHLPAAIDDVVARAMAKSPDDRYASAGAMANAAAAALGFEPLEHPGPARPSKPSKPGGSAPKRATSGRRLLVAGVAVALVVALLALLLPAVLGGTGGEAQAATPAGMALISQTTGEQRGFVPLSQVHVPAEAIFAAGSYWVFNLDPLQFLEISPQTGRIVRRINAPFDDVAFYTVADGVLYVSEHNGNRLARIELSRGRQLEPTWSVHREHGSLGWPIVVGGTVWVGSEDGYVYHLDSTGKVADTVGVIESSDRLAFDGRFIWVAGGDHLVRLDPGTLETTATDAPGGTGYLTTGGGFVWTADETKGEVYKIDSSGTVVDTYTTGDGARTVSYDPDADELWVGNQDAGTVTSIDALTGKTRNFRFGHPLQAVAAGAGTVLVQLNQGRTYEDRIDALHGSVARLLVDPYQMESDPAISYSNLGFEVSYATCAPLLGYADAEGAEGATLQPEVASDVEIDGSTYRFTIRTGFRFSPPSNQRVTAETFRFSIERALSRAMGDQAPGSYFVPDIEGEDAFRDGKADHISGLQASGDALTITLTAPSPDFLSRITMPFFCPVPTDSPVLPEGVAQPLPGGAGRQTTPAAGRYFVADAFGGEYTILEKNPNYGGSHPGHFDSIALREGVDPGQAVERVRDGTWDGIVHMNDPLLAPDGPVASRYGTPAAGDPVYTAVPMSLFTDYVEFNAAKGHPFSDLDLRRAAAFALDRPALAAAYGGEFPNGVVADAGMVAPNFPGVPEMPFSADGPDLDAARRLLQGRTPVHVTMPVSTNCDQCRRQEDAVVQQLEAVGFRVDTVEEEDPYQSIHDHPGSYDLRGAGSAPDWPDLATYMPLLFGEYIPASWLPPGVADAATAVTNAPPDERYRRALEFLAGPVADSVPATGTGDSVAGMLLSPRLGCQLFPPFGSGVDLAALCPAAGSSPHPGDSSPA
ncbi:MAG TPA: ABC transporter substrate-binding protein [Actinomycetota bacterium]